MSVNKEILERYATLKIEIEKLENEVSFLQPEVLKQVQEIKATAEDPTKPVTTENLKDLGFFQVGSMKTWHYPEAVMDMKAALTKAENDAKADGTAKFEEKNFIIFKKVKSK